MRIAAIGLAAGLLLAGCGSSDDSAQGGNGDKLLVATTVSPITSIAANIGGDLVDVEGIVPEGTNSHTFEPDPSVAGLLSDADLILVNGLKLEDPTLELAEANKRTETEIVEVGTTVLPESEYIYDFSFPKEEGKPNPHLWTDPVLASEYAAVMPRQFSELDPANAATTTRTCKAFLAKTTALADALEADQASVPGGIKLLTYHDAYAYFGKDYGWDVIGAIQPQQLRRPDPVGGRRAHRPGQGREGAGDLRVGGVPLAGAGGDRQRGRCAVHRRPARRRPARRAGRSGALVAGPDALRLPTMIEGLGGQAPTLKSLDVSDVAPDNAEYPQ